MFIVKYDRVLRFIYKKVYNELFTFIKLIFRMFRYTLNI